MSKLITEDIQHPLSASPNISLLSNGNIGGVLGDTLASKLPYAFGTATPTATDEGFLWYDSNSTPASTKFWDGSAFVPFGGKILQVVRATDGTARSTTSTTFVDASISVTITPQRNTSAILLVWTFIGNVNNNITLYQITDNSNNPISGAEQDRQFAPNNVITRLTMIAYATPATTSATTYKGRFRVTAGTGNIENNNSTGQLYAIEVSA